MSYLVTYTDNFVLINKRLLFSTYEPALIELSFERFVLYTRINNTWN